MNSTPKHALPEALRTRLAEVGARLERQQSIADVYAGIDASLNELAPNNLVRAEREIFETAKLWRQRSNHPGLLRLLSPRISDREQLERVPGLEVLFIFHRDGYVREAALKKIAGALPGAFLFSAIAWRLNDWVEPVRLAARDCASRCFPLTGPDVIAGAALTLLARENSWSRWSKERDVLDAAFSRPDVVEALARAITSSVTGPMATILRYALRQNALDGYLEMFAARAAQPFVRATAAQALIDGHASWPRGGHGDGSTSRWAYAGGTRSTGIDR